MIDRLRRIADVLDALEGWGYDDTRETDEIADVGFGFTYEES